MRRLREVHTRHELSPRQFQLLGLLHDSGPLGQSYNFHAFADSQTFDRVVILGPGANDGRVVMDNLRFGAAVGAPEPASVVLAGLGILGLAGAARRRGAGRAE